MSMRAPVVALVLLASLVGCTAGGEQQATPTPPPPSQQTGSGTPPALGAFPAIPRSFDMGNYTANPCTLLDKADFDLLGFAGQFVVIPPNPGDAERTCEVGGGSEGGNLQLTLRTDVQPLQQVYDDRSGKSEFVHAVDLVGMPAVVRAYSVRFSGDCEVVVATGKQQGFRLVHSPAPRQGGTIGICGRLATVAERLLTKLGA